MSLGVGLEGEEESVMGIPNPVTERRGPGKGKQQGPFKVGTFVV